MQRVRLTVPLDASDGTFQGVRLRYSMRETMLRVFLAGVTKGFPARYRVLWRAGKDGLVCAKSRRLRLFVGWCDRIIEGGAAFFNALPMRIVAFAERIEITLGAVVLQATLQHERLDGDVAFEHAELQGVAHGLLVVHLGITHHR